MTTLETMPETTVRLNPAEIEAEPLFDVQLLVARRADVLARRQPRVSPNIDRRVWLRAELEVFDGAGRKHA